MTRENLSTAGNEFVLPNGRPYTGGYHIHVSKGAMVGATHSSEKHNSLTPLNIVVKERVKSIQIELKAAQQNEKKLKSIQQNEIKQKTRTARQPQTPTPTPSSSGGGGY